MAAWNWAEGRLERLDDWRGLTESTSLLHLGVALPGGQPILATERGVRVLARRARPANSQAGTVTVTSCLLTASGTLVTAGRQDRTVRWFSADGLRLLGLRSLPAQPLTLAQWDDTATLCVGAGNGLVLPLALEEDLSPVVLAILPEPVVSLAVGRDGVLLAAGDGEVER